MVDKAYEAERNKLIPFAERFADELYGTTNIGRPRSEWASNWNIAFLGEMNRLWQLTLMKG
uniref:Uncharacterized protein n=1 Tax=viral metagenome TaxID=1070528 RepID=A0A6M3IU95_9ZZZZ